MAEELKIVDNASRENTNLSPVNKIEIYSFFDPFNKDCFKSLGFETLTFLAMMRPEGL